jgi:hypothetical protein
MNNSKKVATFAEPQENNSYQSTYKNDFPLFYYQSNNKSNQEPSEAATQGDSEIRGYDRNWTKTEAIKRFTQENPEKYNLFDAKIYHYGKALTALSPAIINRNLMNKN